MGYADEWFLHPSIPEWEKKMVVEGMDVNKEKARKLAESGKLPIHKVVEWCSEGRERRQIKHKFDVRDKSIIEIGCGRGYYTQFLAKDGSKICALDKMSGNREKHMWDEFKGVLKGHGLWDNVFPLQVDAREIPIPDDSFDIATCAAFFRDLYPENSQKEVIKEMLRVSNGLRLAVYVDKDLDKAQKNFVKQLVLRKRAQKALEVKEQHLSHPPATPLEVKQWFEDIVDIKEYEFLDPDLKGEYAGNVDHYVHKLDGSHPEKGELEESLAKLNKKIGQYGCKRPTIMLIWT